MNKKFSTLVAMLLASGGLFYAVDAMVLPASEGVAKTFVAVATAEGATEATAEVVACNFKIASGFTAAWKVVKVDNAFYLEVKAAPGWFLCEDGIKKVEGADYVSAKAIAVTLNGSKLLVSGDNEVVIAENGAVTLAESGGNAYLYTAAETPLGSLTENTVVALSTEKTVNAVGASDVKWTETAEVPGTVKVAAEVATATNKWSLEAGTGGFESNFYLKINEAYLKSDGSAFSLVSECPNDAESAVTVASADEGKAVLIGGKYLSNKSGSLHLDESVDDETGFYLLSSPATSGLGEAQDATKTNFYVVSVAKSGLNNAAASWSELAQDDAVEPAEAKIEANTSGAEFTPAEKWTVAADGAKLTFKAGEKYLSAPSAEEGNAELVIEGEATPITLDADGALKSDELYLVNDGGTIKTVSEVSDEAKLYLFAEDGKLVTENVVAGTYIIAELKSKTIADKSVDVTVTYQEATEPGAAIEGMTEAGVMVENGEIKLLPSTTNTDNIPAPFTIVGDGFKELAGQSWILEGGKLINLAAQKAGKDAMYLGYLTTKAADPTYALVEENDPKVITGIAYTSNGLTIGSTTATATLKTTGEALALIVKGQLTSVNSGDIVRIVDENNAVEAQYKIVIGTLSNNNYSYSFVKCDIHGKESTPKTYLAVGEETDFTGKKYDGSFSLQTKDGSYLEIKTGALAKAASGQPSLTLFAYKIQADAKAYTVDQLLNNFGSKASFGVALAHKYLDEDGKPATKSITTGNVFADADLVPVKYVSTAADGEKLVALTGDKNNNEEAILLKSGDRYIVLETTKDSEWTSINDDLKNGGYKFATVSEKAMLEILKDGEFDNKTYAPYFTFNYDNATNVGGKGKAVYNIEVKDYNKASIISNTPLYISSFEVKNGAQQGVYLTVTSNSAYWVAAELGLNNLVKAKSDNSPLNHTYVNIQFANHPSVKDYSGKLLNGRVLGANLATADKSEFLFNKPEGQWIVNVTGQDGELNKKGVEGLKDATSFTFVNRESGRPYTVDAMYYLGDNKYAVSPASSSSRYAASPANRDTLIITGVQEKIVAGTAQRDGYADLKALDVQDELFRLLVASAEEDYYVGENHTAKSHFLGLSHSEEAAVNWRIVPLTGAREYDKDGFLKTATDSIYEFRHSHYFNGDKLFSKNDTLAIVGYALQNVANGEYLTYENPQTTTIQSMICDPNFTSFKTTKDVSNAYRFVLKEKGTDLYNIVSVSGNPTYDADGYLNSYAPKHFSLGTNKLYGATTLTKQGAVEVDYIYNRINSNDLFKVQKVGAPEYRLMNMGDTIRIFRQENEYDQMFEKGEFLNIGNKAQLTDMAPALYVDTAYVKRGHNNRYQYLLVVEPKYVPAEPCNIPGHPTVHPDTTYGRFLVNLIDTANVAYQKGAIHTNKYINDTEAGETRAKLGFVYGFRTADKLYITDKNFQKSGKASDVIDLSTRDFNVAKFAFRYINPINHESDGSFKIQTGYYDYDSYIATNKQPEVSNNGYLKNINGVLVVENTYDKGDKFDLAIEHSDPTANDAISANGVSVAAIDGAVIVKGAAGKTVVITNILGQTIANAVLSSDNETIAAPAGVVVVSVEGEAAVKAIVK